MRIFEQSFSGKWLRRVWLCGLLAGLAGCSTERMAVQVDRQPRIERWIENPERIRFRASDSLPRPARADSYRWNQESLLSQWRREADGSWVTLISPPLHYRALVEIDHIELVLSEGPSSAPPVVLFWDQGAKLSERARLKNKRELTALQTADPIRFSVRGETLADVDAFVPERDETPPRHLFLRYPAGKAMEIESVQVIGLHAALGARAHGFTRRTVQGEVRDALFCRTPCSITYPLASLPRGSTLRTGLQSQPAGVPLDYAIALESAGRRQILLEARLEQQEGWLDLAYSFERDWIDAEIQLRAGSERPGEVVLWANPLIVPPQPPERPPNLILYVIDSLRPDRVQAARGTASPAPFLTSLIDSGIYFENCYATASWTKPSVTSLLTSLHPIVHGVGRHSYADILPEGVPTLQSILQRNGYLTASFSANPFSSTLSNLDQGFDSTYTPNAFQGADAAAGAKIYSEALTDRILSWVQSHQRHPFFIFVHSMDVHPPLQVISTSGENGEDTSVEQLYARALRHNDGQLQRLYRALETRGLDTRTLLIVTADHGRALGEHGQDGHGTTVYQEEIRVPLLWVQPGRLLPSGVRSPASLLDVLPTVLGYLQISFEAERLQGKVLFPAGSTKREREILVPRFFYPEDSEIERYREEMLALIAGRWKLILHRSAGRPDRHELYDLDLDPWESRNLVNSNSGRSLQLEQRMSEWLARLEKRGAEFRTAYSEMGRTESLGLDIETLERLRSLGYIR